MFGLQSHHNQGRAHEHTVLKKHLGLSNLGSLDVMRSMTITIVITTTEEFFFLQNSLFFCSLPFKKNFKNL